MPLPSELHRTRFTNPVGIGFAVACWAGAWLLGNILASVVLVVSGESELSIGQRSPWTTVATAIAIWLPQLAMLALVAQRMHVASRRLYGVSIRPMDALGIPIGVAAQLIVLPLLYLPLVQLFPDTFSDDDLQRNARELFDSATGIGRMALVLVIVVGAPIVEELVYRGLIYGSMANTLTTPLAILGSAAFFAIIHFRAVEYLGLFAIGVILAMAVAQTGRLGLSIVTHAAFNATALVALTFS